ncbi:MAG: undecaprenyldiphospho-muramoylpentapeptide beta-N-acetylglucosaminyltransferase [Chitinophagales bacterium]|nr:undecaprenyldiphospho-muramoylpentapeptide beta-N-acetylglucosaminyltransferase [Chitinophagales bacterium]
MREEKLKAIISGGGTGGHIFPAIAIGNALKNIHPSMEILFIGATGRMEMETVPKYGFKILGLPVAGLQRGSLLKNLMLPVKVLLSLAGARSIIQEFKPHVVVGVGGYASGPVLFVASMMRKPTLIQEQNSHAGITNKILGKRVDKICVAYDHMDKFFPAEKIMITGNPVRKDIRYLEGKKEEAIKYFKLNPGLRTLLVVGGSLGSRVINESIRIQLEPIRQERIQVIWQTGKNYFSEYDAALKGFDEKIKIMSFIDRMDLAYAVADVVISRAGALSISELCLASKASVLVPSPNVAEDHQTKNAMALVNKEAALYVNDGDALKDLVTTALQLIKNEPLQQRLRLNISKLAKPHADDAIAEEVMKLVHEGVSKPHRQIQSAF